jgi:hypothetical protein
MKDTLGKEFYESADKTIKVTKQETLEEATNRVVGSGLYNSKTLFKLGVKWYKERSYSKEEILAFGKSCFYKGFEKAENDDANCYTAFREEIGNLIEQFKNK